MREQILDEVRSEQLRIYAVWLNQRSTDARDEVDASILADPRVTQYWDEQGVSGRYFAKTDLGGLGYAGFVYDAYYVFGAEAAWMDEPGPLSGSGVPVIGEAERLLTTLQAQL